MMIDDHAKQATDNSSAQNKANEEDLHGSLLNTSNPAFRTLRAMGISGEIKPEKNEKTETTSLTVDKVEKLKTAEKKVKKSKKSKDETKDKSSSTEKKRKVKELMSPMSQMVRSVNAPPSEKVKAGANYSELPSETLSHFSQWLATLPKSTVTEIPESIPEQPTEAKVEEETPLQTGPKTITIQSHEPKMVQSRETIADPQQFKESTPPLEKETSQPQEKIARPKNIAREDQEVNQPVAQPKRKKKKKKKKKRPGDSGVVLSDDIFSETLADLLASQGHYRQAIHMYEKMRLIYPEKSRFFAAKIEELNKKE